MGRMYTGIFESVAVSAIQDLFEIVAPADAVVVIHACFISQSSEEGDSQDEQLHISWTRGHTTSGSAGSTPTAQPLNPGDTAASATVEANNTTQATAGSPVVLWSESFNVRAGWAWIPTPEARIILAPSQRLVLELPTAPADSVTMDGTIVFEEIGS